MVVSAVGLGCRVISEMVVERNIMKPSILLKSFSNLDKKETRVFVCVSGPARALDALAPSIGGPILLGDAFDDSQHQPKNAMSIKLKLLNKY
jgi:hypothetical protein